MRDETWGRVVVESQRGVLVYRVNGELIHPRPGRVDIQWDDGAVEIGLPFVLVSRFVEIAREVVQENSLFVEIPYHDHRARIPLKGLMIRNVRQ